MYVSDPVYELERRRPFLLGGEEHHLGQYAQTVTAALQVANAIIGATQKPRRGLAPPPTIQFAAPPPPPPPPAPPARPAGGSGWLMPVAIGGAAIGALSLGMMLGRR
jgi:hypothetical protein